MLYLQATKNSTAVKLTVVSTPPVVEVRIRRPDTKYQLGFSVQNGVVKIIYYCFVLFHCLQLCLSLSFRCFF